MKFLFLLLLVPFLIIPAFAESQTLPTEEGTLDVKLTYEPIEQNIQTKINIDFINPFTQRYKYILTIRLQFQKMVKPYLDQLNSFIHLKVL